MSALAWWWLPFSTALSFTIGLIVLSSATRAYRPRTKKKPRKTRRYGRAVAVRVVSSEPRVRVEAPEHEHEQEEEEVEDAREVEPRRRRRR